MMPSLHNLALTILHTIERRGGSTSFATCEEAAKAVLDELKVPFTIDHAETCPVAKGGVGCNCDFLERFRAELYR